jgi:hypothetical protein
MRIVPAGVHDAWVPGTVLHMVRLLDWQSVDIGS